MKRLLLLFFLLPAIGWCGSAAGPLDSLTPDEFRAAGLHKLSEQELSALKALLARAPELSSAEKPGQPVASLPRGEEAFGQEQKLHERVEHLQRVPRKISSRIQGEFKGWRGRTVFTLENGQVWQQVAPGEFAVWLTDPVVFVEKGALGAFYLRVEGFGSQVKVKRVK